MTKCKKCDKEATFDSPDDFCDEHGVEWCADGVGETPEEKGEMKKEALDNIKDNQDRSES